jgi:hypothetical protein
MSLAAASSSYPILDIFWTILLVFLWVIWFWILITVIIDIFRSPDLQHQGLWVFVAFRVVVVIVLCFGL